MTPWINYRVGVMVNLNPSHIVPVAMLQLPEETVQIICLIGLKMAANGQYWNYDHAYVGKVTKYP